MNPAEEERDFAEQEPMEEPKGANSEIPLEEPETITCSKEEWEHLHYQIQETKTKYLQLLAETENVRKRLAKEKEEATRYAMESVITALLPPIDHFEQALKFAEATNEEVKQWAFGFEMLITQFTNILAEFGVSSFASEGKLFDPHFHEAIEIVETEEVPAGTILQEFSRGYVMRDRVIRPARVKVAKSPKETTPSTPAV